MYCTDTRCHECTRATFSTTQHTVNCTVLYCMQTVHCALYTAPHCTALPPALVHQPGLWRYIMHYTALLCSSHCTALHCQALQQWTAVHCTTLPMIGQLVALQSITLHRCTAVMHCQCITPPVTPACSTRTSACSPSVETVDVTLADGRRWRRR